MRDYLILHLNGIRREIRGSNAFLTLAQHLRHEERITGTKIVCEEGDCGACTVLVGRPEDGRMRYRPVNSCIQFLLQLDGAHVVTVEGLARRGLSAVQDSMVACHGAQCGYCTPGFVMTMTDLVASNGALDEETVRSELTGNLCRCTGYDPIIRAALEADRDRVQTMDELYPPGTMIEALRKATSEPVRIETDDRVFFRPTTLEDAVRFRAGNPGAVVIQGGTDLGVLANKRGLNPNAILALDGIAHLDDLGVDDGMLVVGGRVTIAALKAFGGPRIPELDRILEWFGAPQIRNAGTLAGNIANASPIADTVPFLLVMEAKLELTGSNGSRVVDITSFYKGYKSIDLEPDELITRIFIPLPADDEILKLYRVSKRRNLDIASFTSAFLMKRSNGAIDSIRIAYGGVAPIVLRLPKTEAFLEGKPFTLESFVAAGEIATSEISPISDVRGSAAFRSTLARNVLKKLYVETASDEALAEAS